MTILISGAGIAGLTLAHVCEHFGLEYRIFETAQTLRQEGAGIQLSPNAMRVFAALGLTNAIEDAGHQPGCGEVRAGKTGKRLLAFPLAGAALAKFGAPYVQIRRGKLLEMLAKGINIEFGNTLTDPIDSVNNVTIKSDRDIIEGSFLVGADGINSAIRQNLFGANRPRFTGYVAWRTWIDTQKTGLTIAPNAIVRIGRTGHVVSYPMGDGLVNFVGVLKSKNIFAEGWMQPAGKHDATLHFAEFGTEVSDMIDSAEPLYKWGLFDRPPLPVFHKRRIALMGDAAHPILPFLAQGGAMAIEDAWALGHAIATDNLDHYSRARTARTRRIQQASKTQSHIYHLSNPIKQAVFERGMRATHRLKPNAGLTRLSWVYGYDVIAATASPA